jgi:hypothetical protein
LGKVQNGSMTSTLRIEAEALRASFLSYCARLSVLLSVKNAPLIASYWNRASAFVPFDASNFVDRRAYAARMDSVDAELLTSRRSYKVFQPPRAVS